MYFLTFTNVNEGGGGERNGVQQGNSVRHVAVSEVLLYGWQRSGKSELWLCH